MSSVTGQAPAGAAVIPLASMAGSVPAQRVLSWKNNLFGPFD